MKVLGYNIVEGGAGRLRVIAAIIARQRPHLLVGDCNALRADDPIGTPPPGVVPRGEAVAVRRDRRSGNSWPPVTRTATGTATCAPLATPIPPPPPGCASITSSPIRRWPRGWIAASAWRVPRQCGRRIICQCRRRFARLGGVEALQEGACIAARCCVAWAAGHGVCVCGVRRLAVTLR